MRLLRISSADALPGYASKYDISFSTGDNDLNQVSRVMLKSAVIPNTQYNIHSHNNTFVYEIANVPQPPVVIPQGQYLMSDLITAFNAAFLAESGITMTAVQNTLTKKISFATSSDIGILNKADGNPMGDVFGIVLSTLEDGPTYACAGLPNLVGLRHIYIASNALASNTNLITSAKTKYPIFADVPITVPFGGLQTVDNSFDTMDSQTLHGKHNISNIDITLLDEHNEIVELNGHDFILMFWVD